MNFEKPFIFFLIFLITDLLFPSPLKFQKSVLLLFFLILFLLFTLRNFPFNPKDFLIRKHYILFSVFFIIFLNILLFNFHFTKTSILKNFSFQSLLFLCFFYSFLNLKDVFEFEKNVIKILYIAVSFEFLLSLIQFFNRGFAFKIFLPQGEVKQTLWTGCSIGTFPHPNFLGTFMGITSIFFLFNFKKSFINKIALLFSILGMLLSHSRDGILTFLAIFLLYLVLNFSKKRENKTLILWIILIFLFQIIPFVIFRTYFLKKRIYCLSRLAIGGYQCDNFPVNSQLLKYYDVDGDKFLTLRDEIIILNLKARGCDFLKLKREKFNLLKKIEFGILYPLTFRDPSYLGRLLTFESCLKIIGDHPISGIGVSNYVKSIKSYTLVPEYFAYNLYHPHNLYLLILCEFGLPMGFILFAIFFYYLLKRFEMSPYYFVLIYLAISSSFDISFYSEGGRILIPLSIALLEYHQQMPS